MADVSPEVLRLFSDELAERTRSIDGDLVQLERACAGDRPDLIARLLREAHSLKGAAGSVGAAQIAEICHGIEDLLSTARDDVARVDAGLVEALFSRVDLLREASQGFATPRTIVSRAHPAASITSTVRVASEKLDGLMRESGELQVANHHAAERLEEVFAVSEMLRRLQSETRAQRWHTQVREIERALARVTTGIANGQSAVRRAASRVDTQVRRIRMVPFSSACDGLERLVRDASRALGRSVALEIRGSEIEIDRGLAQRLRDPLAHLVRNAVDHGIESPDRRRTLGKPEHGSVVVSAALRGGGVEIVVSDDGAGFDVNALRQRAAERGFAVDDSSLVYLPGVSTAKTVTSISGRGVGLDVVRSTVETLRGTIAFTSTPGRGTRFVLTLPLTLSTLRALLIELDGKLFALDQSIVDRVEFAERNSIISVEGRPVVVREGAPLPLVPLHAIFGGEPAEPPDRLSLLVVDAGGRRIGLIVDRVVDEREIVVRSLGVRLEEIRPIAGGTILHDGTLALIGRSSYIIERALELAQTWRLPQFTARDSEAPSLRVLLVDDSITTRTLECSILEAAGYDVMTASDGSQALAILERQRIDIVVSDVDMPDVDGFELTERMRKSEQLRDIPIVLVTARSSEDDRRRGLESGADAYILKRGFDQRDLLETLRALVS